MDKRFDIPAGAGLPRLATIPLSRRGALVLGTAASWAVVAAAPNDAVASESGGVGLRPVDRFDELRTRWLDHLVGAGGIGFASPALVDRNRRLSEYAAWAYDGADHTPGPGDAIWPDLPLRGPDPASITTTYRRVLKVATAWATPGTDQYRDAAVENTLLGWYRYLAGSWYHAGAEPVGNWWFWEIGVPRVLADLTLILQDRLGRHDVEHALHALRTFTPDPSRIAASDQPATGANRADKALSCLLRGVISQSPQDMMLGRDALLDTPGNGTHSLVSYTTSGDGFYSDGSYIHHLVLPYAGTYGKAALAAVAPAVMLLDGTRWNLSPHALQSVLDSPERTFAPFIWNGRMMETVRGRAVAREHEPDYRDAWGTAEAVMLLAQHVDDPYRSRYRALAKGWLARCGEEYRPTSASDLRRAEQLLADDSVEAAPEQPGHVQFGVQERMVHRGAGWAFTVATSSDRIGRYGWGNGENRYGWHQGDGASYLYLDNDQGQFSDDYWPTVDPYRLPGTTASLTERAPGPDSGTPVPEAWNRWAGGVCLSGRWGSTGMDLTNALGDVRCKKSWFLLDDAVVAVGSGLVVTGPGAETTVENRSFPEGSAPRLVVDGDPVSSGKPVRLETARWAHLDGIAGYVFLDTHTARASIADRSGSWYDINQGGDTAGSRTPCTRTYATLSLTHPTGTDGGRYGYLILPHTSADDTRRHAASGRTHILRADSRAHVVRTWRGDRWFLFAHVFEAVDDGKVRADGPCAILASGTQSVARIAVADPTKSDTQVAIQLVLDDVYPAVVRSHGRLEVSTGRTVDIRADLDRARGGSFEAVLTR